MTISESKLITKIKILNESVWEWRASQGVVDDWLGNFEESERLKSLFLLSNFMYFGSLQMRELMTALYRDLFKTPLIHEIRKNNKDTKDYSFVQSEFREELGRTKFIGIGNPSESGCHLLYYLRQENGLSKRVFAHTHELLSRTTTEEGTITTSLRYPDVNRYVFIDDFCGTGQQTATYLKGVIDEIKDVNANVKLSYYVLFGTTGGLQNIKSKTNFDCVEAVIELDDTFKVFSDGSRFFNDETGLDKDEVEEMCRVYGGQICSDPLGYGDCQLLIGFHHNIPDNTLPIIWSDGLYGGDKNWSPIFKRYNKIY